MPLIDILLNLSTQKVQVFPLTYLEYDTYSEEEQDSLKSYVKISSNNDSFVFNYQLKEKTGSIYAGVMFYQSNSSGIVNMDLNGVNKAFISLKADEGKRVPIYLICDYDYHVNGKDTVLIRPFEAFINYSSNRHDYRIDFEEFNTPNWWFTENGINEAEIGGILLDKISSINIENCKVIANGVDDSIAIKEFYLYSDNMNLFVRATSYTVAAYLLAIIIFGLLKRKKILVTYEPTITKSSNKRQVNSEILEYITANYMNTECSLNFISTELEISALDISKLIKEKYQLSFKKYLNKLRITEVKRLLEESELSISEIAYQVGYNNISHFNRIFKSETEISPKEYRNNLHKS